ncbi:hypothetical protein Tco_0624953 [Tanacetum coccineum]|uniref:No apical meristem-associated C-terminal domain-containing protein n=1 Tax=Tanacetum coccineum TaxID=301880 RepID=A0ABQ4WFE9_9ASTR
MESSMSYQANQPYHPLNRVNLDMDFEQLMYSQEYYPTQDYSMGHGLAHDSAYGLAHGSALVDDDEDDYPIEEMSPVKAKKPSRQNSEKGNNMKAKGFGEVVIKYFERKLFQQEGKDEGETRFLYIVKNQELDIREAERREAAELKREKLAIQRQTLELAEREKQDKDILFYNSEIGSYLPAIQQQKLH